MFEKDAFESWPLVFTGAAVLAGLFVVVLLLGQYVSGGRVRLTGAVVGVGVAAFLGYVGVALLLRHE